MIYIKSLNALLKNVAIMFAAAFVGIGTVNASPLACSFDNVEELESQGDGSFKQFSWEARRFFSQFGQTDTIPEFKRNFVITYD